MAQINFNLEETNIIINEQIEETLTSLIQKDNERGGVLMGQLYPNSNIVKLTHIIECPYLEQSKYGLLVDNKALNEEINKIWEDDNTITYIGDWHTHPEKNPTPSYTDIDTIKDKFVNAKISSNFLIDIIIGYEENFIKSFDGKNFYDVGVLNG